MPAGAPSKTFSQRIANQICERVATSVDALPDILAEIKARDPRAPGVTTCFKWLKTIPAFAKQYAHARVLQSHLMADMIVKEAINPRIGEIKKKGSYNGKATMEVRIEDNVSRSRLICDVLFKRMGQLNPKVYNERLMDPASPEDNQLSELSAAIRESAKIVAEKDKEVQDKMKAAVADPGEDDGK